MQGKVQGKDSTEIETIGHLFSEDRGWMLFDGRE